MRTDEGVCPYYFTLSFLLCYSVCPSYYAVPRWQEPLERKQGNAFLYWMSPHNVGTDALVCPPNTPVIHWYIVHLADRRGRLSLLCYSVFLTLLLCLPFLLCCPLLVRTAGMKTRKRPSQCEKGVPLYQRRRLLVMRKRLLIFELT